MKVIVLGAGVIGVTTAYFLARNGHEVTVLEKNSAPALGCSYANGGQLSYSHIEPWASKTSIKLLAKAAFLSPSFLTISDFSNRDFLKWSYQFFKNSCREKSHQTSKKLYKLGTYSKKLLEEIIANEPELEFNYKNEGILHFFRTQKSFEIAIKEAEFAMSLGCSAQVLNKDECAKKEPTLSKLADENKLAGGIFYEGDASGNTMLFTQSLEKICREKYGVTFEYNADIRNLFTNYERITGINTSAGVFVADKYISALGAAGNKLLKGIGIDTKIYPLKGYSLSIQADEEFLAPNMALTDTENKIVYSRVGDLFRAAGTVEACGNRPEKNQKHLDFLQTVIRSTFSDFGNLNKASDWCGFRPFRPNSIPLICQIKKYQNLIINAGHGSLGWTMAAASGKISSDLVLDKKNEQFSFLAQEEESIYINN